MAAIYFDTDVIWKLSAAGVLDDVVRLFAGHREPRRLKELEHQIRAPDALPVRDYDAETLHRVKQVMATMPLQPLDGTDQEFYLLNQMLVEGDSLFVTHDKRALRQLARRTDVDLGRLHGRIVCLEAVVLALIAAYGSEAAALWARCLVQAPNIEACAADRHQFESCMWGELARLQRECHPGLVLWSPS